MRTEFLVRLAVIAAALNAALTTTLLFGRPDLAVRESAERLYAVAYELEKKGDYEEAAKLYEKIFYDMSSTLIAPKAGDRLADIYRRRLFDVEKARDVLREAASFNESAYAADARKDLEFMEKHWGEDGSVLKIWYQASHAFRSNDNGRSLELLRTIIQDHASSSLKPLALVRAARIHIKMGNKDEARKLLQDCVNQHADDPAAEEARSLMAGLR